MRKLLGRFNLSYLYALLGEATLALTFLLYILLARVLGPAGYEIFAAAVALGAILSLFLQFGFPTLLTREVAANPETGPQSTLKYLLLEVLNLLPVMVILLPLTLLLGYKGDGIIVCYLVVLSELCRSAKLTVRGLIKGMAWFKMDSVSVALERFLTVALCCLVLFATKNLVLVVATLVLVRIADILGLLLYLSRKVNLWSGITWHGLIESLRSAFPFALSGVLWILYYQVDVVMLKAIAPVGEAGYYSAAYRLLEIFSALPRVIFYVVFTQFARAHATAPEQLPEQIYKASRLLLAIVLPALLMAEFAQTNLVHFIYGQEFSPAIQPLAILLASLSIKIFGTLGEQFFQATGREKTLPLLLFSAAMTNIVVNAILIPILGGVGAAIATLISEFVLAIASLILFIRFGFQDIGKRLCWITGLSFAIAALPCLTLIGLPPITAFLLILPLAALMVVLMQRDRFLKATA